MNILNITIDYDRCYSIYHSILDCFDYTDIKPCHKRVVDKEIGRNGQDNQTFNTDVINAIVWAFRHDQPTIAETGLETLIALIRVSKIYKIFN